MFSAKKNSPGPNYGLLRSLVSLLVLMIMVAWFTDDVLRGGKVPFFRDLSTYFYPSRVILARSFQAGEIPFWNRQLGMGFPFLASPQSAVFYPPNIVFAVLPFFGAIRLLFVFHYLVAATGAYVLCLRWGTSQPLALLGANLFAFGGVIVSLSNLMDHFQTAVWMPWVLYFIDRCVYRLSRSNFVVLVLACLMQILAGSPEIWLMTLCLGFLVGIRAKADGGDVTFGRILLLLCGSNLVAAGLAMMQIIPSLELFLESWRSETIPYTKASAWSIDPWRLINFFFLDKEVNLHTYNGLSLFLAKEPPFLLSLYLGAITPPGILLWMTKSSNREKAVVLGLVLGTLLLAMGSYVPLHRILFEYFPVLGRIRFPEKFLFLTFALLWYMTLNGLSQCLREETTADRRFPYIVFAAAPLLFLSVYVFYRLHLFDLIALVSRRTGMPLYDVGNLRIASGLMVNLERQIVLLTTISVLLLLWKKGTVRCGILQVLLMAITFFDLTSAHQSYHFSLAPEVIEKTPRILSSPDREMNRVFYLPQLGTLHPNAYVVPRKDFAHTIAAVFSSLTPNSGVFFGFQYMQEMDALRRKPYESFLRQDGQLLPERLFHLLGVLNVAYVARPKFFSDEELRLIQSFPENAMWLYGVRTVVPRTYIVPEIVIEKEPAKIMERVASRSFNPLRQVILENGPASSHQEGFRANAAVVEYSDTRVKIRASLNGPGVLVLADSFYPGWRVYVNGEKGEILKANFFSALSFYRREPMSWSSVTGPGRLPGVW